MNFSVVIPTKNVPTLLKRCIESIPQRADLEIIVVDDCSTNECIAETQEYIKYRNDVTLCLNPISKGAGYCRNIGIEKSTGKWLLFADSDDFYTTNFNEILDKYKDDNESDIVYINAQGFDEETGNITPLRIGHYIQRYQKHCIYSEKVLRYAVWTPWTRMVRRKLVIEHNLRFEEIPTGNDMMFCLNCSKFAKTIIAEPTVTYIYYTPIGASLTGKYYKSLETLENKILLKERVDKLHDSVGYAFKGSFIGMYLSAANSIDKKSYRKNFRVIIKKKHITIDFFKDLYHLLLKKIAAALGIL